MVKNYRAPVVIDLSRALVDYARTELGCGEVGANNCGVDVDRYRCGRRRGAWCAYFVSYCLEQTCDRLQVPCPVKGSGGARRLFANVVKAGRRSDIPSVGAIALWSRGARGSWMGHVGIVSSVSSDGSFWVIEGNRGRYPSKVREYQHELGEAGLLGFAVLPPCDAYI